MRKSFLICTLGLCLLATTVLADDDTPLGPDASADDVKQVIDRDVPPILKHMQSIQSGATMSTPVDRQNIAHVVNLLKEVKPKVLLEAMGQLGPLSILNTLSAQILMRALEASATEADIPDLLASDVTVFDTDNTLLVVGPLVIIKHPQWCNNPIVTASLPDILTAIQTQLSSSPQHIEHQGVLRVANLDPDSGIQSQLKDIVTNACTATDMPPDFLLIVFDTAKDSTNASIHALLPNIVKAEAADSRFKSDPNSPDLASKLAVQIEELISSGSAPLNDPDFVSGAKSCLQSVEHTNGYNDFDCTVALARLGEPIAFANAMKVYFETSESDLSNKKMSDAGGLPEDQIRIRVRSNLLPAIAFHGPGDKIQALKDHYQDAVYQNGQWILTLAGDGLTTAPDASPAPTPSPPIDSSSTTAQLNASPNEAPTYNLQALPANSLEVDVKAAVDNAASEINALYPDIPNKQRTSPETEKATQRLSNIRIKVLLDLLGSIPDSGKNMSELRLFMLKRAILKNAINRYATESDIPDLISGQVGEGYGVMQQHPDWCSSPAATAAFTDELQNIQSDPTIFPDLKVWLLTISPLGLAQLNNNPGIQTLLQKTIDKAASTPQASASLLLAALKVASESENPIIHGELPEIVAALVNKMRDQHFDDENIPVKIALGVSIVVEKNPSLLRDPEFIANATACIKAESNLNAPFDRWRNCLFSGNASTLSVALALLGDSKAFGDGLENYYESKSNADEIEKWLLSSIVYHGSGDKKLDIQNHYRDAVYQNGQWVLTMPDYVPSATHQTVAGPAPATASATTVTSPPVAASSVALPQNTSPVPPAAPGSEPTGDAQKTPVSVAVTRRAPIEQLDSNGRDTGVAMAVVGATYTLVRVDGDQLLLKASDGTEYRLALTATDYSTQPK